MKTIVNENTLRIALIVFNFIFSILSISLIALAATYSKQLGDVKPYIGSNFLAFPTVLLIVGCLSFVMSIAGCYGARSRNRKFFIVFILVLICLLVLEVAVSVIAFINIDSNMANTTRPLMIDQVTSNNIEEKENFHKLEELLKCCGVDGPNDYLHNNENTSCCGFDDCQDELDDDYSHIWFQSGCATVVATETQTVAKETAAVATIYSLLQVFEIGCVFLLQNLT